MMNSTAITPINNPTIWYAMYDAIKETAPEILDQFVERTASDLELPCDYFMQEFLSVSYTHLTLPTIYSV